MDKRDADLAAKAAAAARANPAEGNDTPITPTTQPPVQPTKRRKNVSIKALAQTSSWRIESDADIDTYLAALRTRLEAELDADTIVNVEF